MNWKEFEKIASSAMSDYLGVKLAERKPEGSPKKLDMVSDDENYVGDAKYLTLVGRKKIPPAKFMEIAGYVWICMDIRIP
jgi:hypothetical protein